MAGTPTNRISPATILLALILLVVVAGCVGIYILLEQTTRSVQETADLPRQTLDELRTQVAQMANPTPTIRPNPATLVLQIQQLSRLETIGYTVEKVITAEENQGPFAWLVGDRLLFVAHGQVIAGVDLGKMQAGDIQILGNNRVAVTLPAAEVFLTTLDNDKSYVYERDTGILRGAGNIQLEAAARQAAEDEILKAALEDGILRQAQTNAEVVVRQLLSEVGYTNVTFIAATPVPVPGATVTP